MAGRWVILAALLAFAPPSAARPLTLEGCDERVRRAPDDPGSYYCYVQAAHAEGKLKEAAGRLESILEKRPDLHAARVDLAYLQHDMGLDAAEGTYLQGIAGMEEIGDDWGLVYSHTGLASFLDARGRPDDAEPHLARALEVAQASGDPMMLAHARTQAALHAGTVLDHGEALRLYRLAESTVFPDGPAYLKSWVLSGLGSTYWALGRHALALSIYQRATELSRETGDLYAEAAMRYNIALLAGNLWEGGGLSRERVQALIEEGLAIAVKSGNQEVEGALRLMLAEDAGGPERVRRVREALSALEPMGPSQTLLHARRLLAESLFLQGPEHHEEGLRRLDAAIEEARSLADRHSIARGLILRAALLRLAGRDRGEVVPAYLEALDAIERIRDLQPEGSIRARTFGEWRYAYQRLIGYLLGGLADSPDRQADLALAYEMVERIRSRVLLDTLDGAGVTAERAARPDHIRRDAILEEIAAVQKELLDPGLAAGRREALLSRLEGLEAEEASLQAALARDSLPRRARGDLPAPALRDIQSLLGPGQAMLIYDLHMSGRPLPGAENWDDGRSWVLSISAGGVQAFPLPDLIEVRTRVLVYRGLIERRDSTQREAARRLHDDLLAAPLASLPAEVTRVVIVPDAILGGLPFGTLLSPSGEFVAARFEIFYAPSATLWARWRQSPRRGDGGRGVLGLADPATGTAEGGDHRWNAGPWREGLHLGPLPHAAREAAAMVRRLGGDGLLLERQAAGEGALKSADLSRFDVLHLAAHAVVDDSHPERSAIVLAADEDGEDGLLQFREIVGLDLDDELVLLSACRSAEGEAVFGEGVMSLARAFFEAGARTVVASLLPLRDDETARLMDEFSRGLAGGRSVAGALAAARREMISDGLPPAAWAGLVVLGDGDLVPRPRVRLFGLPVPPGAAGAALVLVLSAAIVLARRIRARH